MSSGHSATNPATSRAADRRLRVAVALTAILALACLAASCDRIPFSTAPKGVAPHCTSRDTVLWVKLARPDGSVYDSLQQRATIRACPPGARS